MRIAFDSVHQQLHVGKAVHEPARDLPDRLVPHRRLAVVDLERAVRLVERGHAPGITAVPGVRVAPAESSTSNAADSTSLAAGQMPLDAFLLALGAAALHAGWNILVARAVDVRAATTVAISLSVILFAPVAALTWDVEAAALPWIAASVVLELAYFLLLTGAYQRSDVSLVYPIARGMAPVLVLIGASVAGTRLGLLPAIGVLLVGTGVLLVRGEGAHADRRGVLLALAIAGTIVGYTLTDNQGIEHASAISYLELQLVPVAVVLLAGYAATGRLPAVRAEIGVASLAAALASFGAYALVLALGARPGSSVAAVRETSVLFAVALGAIVLHERVTLVRAVGRPDRRRRRSRCPR